MYLLVTEYDDDMPPMIVEVDGKAWGYRMMEDGARNEGVLRVTLYERVPPSIYNVVTWRDNRP